MKNVSAALAFIVAAAGFAATASAEDTWKAISFIPKNHPVMWGANAWVNDVNAALKAELQINYVGGPEVVPRYQQTEAVRNKVVDVVFAAAADYPDQIPAAATFPLSKLSPMEERKSGYFDYQVEAHKKLNVQYLGRVHTGAFYLWVKREPKSLADLKGLKMRTGSLYDRFMQELGMVPVNVNAPETYTALESGLVDGFGWPAIGPRQQGWIKKANQVIDLTFFGASNVVILASLERWQALKPEAQKKLLETTAAGEPKMVKHFTDQDNTEWTELAKSGVKRVKFSPAENRQYIDTAYAVEWKYLEAKLGKDELAKLPRMSGN